MKDFRDNREADYNFYDWLFLSLSPSYKFKKLIQGLRILVENIHKRVYTHLYMWKVLEKKTIKKIINNAPGEILIRYEAWKRIVELQGPSGLKLIKGFHDEALRGEWKGFRSSRLGKQWRVIYKIENEHLEVFVVEITPHDYRRKK